MAKKPSLKIAVADCETDPFEFDVIPCPFVWGFEAVDIKFEYFWGDARNENDTDWQCTEDFVSFLYGLPVPYCIYMHNGGKFDFLFLLPYINGSLKIVNGRILEARIGPHTIRDSYAAIPVALSQYKKDDIDYMLMKRDVRNEHRADIIKYLGGDCRYLLEMVTRYREEFGNVLTIGTAAMRELSKFHAFEDFTKEDDDFFRQFYHGGRNQCFASGVIEGDFHVYDVNSMYPSVMSSFEHPVSRNRHISRDLTDDTDFIIVTGKNYGALPLQTKWGLDFTAPFGTFYTTGHEIRAALDTGTFEISSIESAFTFTHRICMEQFVSAFYSKRLDARAIGDELLVLFYKLILNSGYGKFCLNSDNFKDWMITEADEYLDDSLWNIEVQHGDYILWSKPAAQTKYYNVATGASITGAARAQLLRGLASSRNPLYCDTDSIICESLDAPQDSKTLGAWKHEASGSTLAIAGKKLYALFAGDQCIKFASKGARLTPQQIKNVAQGDVELYQSPVPAFKLSGEHQFVSRRIRRTAIDVTPFGAGRR